MKENMYSLGKIIGEILLWLGFIGAALATVWRDVPLDGHTVPWARYAGWMAVGCVGVVMLRLSRAADWKSSEQTEAEFSTLTESLSVLLNGVGELRGICATQSPKAVVKYIDEQLAEPFSDFADARNALVKRFGLEGFADVMTQFASAERFVNRAWSASADGYRGEAEASLERAQGHLQRADALMSELV